MSNRYGITLDSEWIKWAATEKVSETVAAAVLLICETRAVQEVVAKLTPVEFERVVDVVHRSPDHFPSGTLAALKSHSPLPAGRPQSYSVSTDQVPRQGPIGTKPDGDRERGNIGTDRHARRPSTEEPAPIITPGMFACDTNAPTANAMGVPSRHRRWLRAPHIRHRKSLRVLFNPVMILTCSFTIIS